MSKLYAERDIMALDDAGGYYMRHVMAMTGEDLHGKGAIAAELGHRDMQSDMLLSALQKYEEAFDLLFGQCCSNGIFDAWGKRVNCTTLNEAHYMAGKAIRQAATPAAGEGCESQQGL